jgi:hypothetical protein
METYIFKKNLTNSNDKKNGRSICNILLIIFKMSMSIDIIIIIHKNCLLLVFV